MRFCNLKQNQVVTKIYIFKHAEHYNLSLSKHWKSEVCDEIYRIFGSALFFSLSVPTNNSDIWVDVELSLKVSIKHWLIIWHFLSNLKFKQSKNNPIQPYFFNLTEHIFWIKLEGMFLIKQNNACNRNALKCLSQNLLLRVYKSCIIFTLHAFFFRKHQGKKKMKEQNEKLNVQLL